jgi:CBS domain-containing protein
MVQKVRDVMTTNVVVMNENESVRDAARRMKELDIGDVLVAKEGGRLSGILTDRDIVIRALAEGRDGNSKIGEVCSRELVTLSPDMEIDKAVDMMKERAVRRLPVLDGERPIGIVSLGDLAIEKAPESALGRISSAPGSQ